MDTQDKAFILSYSEIVKYMPQWYHRQMAKDYWWVRSPGIFKDRATSVDGDGCFQSNSMRMDNSVRPALWVDETFGIHFGKRESSVCLDGIYFKVLTEEKGKTLLISENGLFNSRYTNANEWGIQYIPYADQVGKNYTGSIREAVNEWFASLPKDGYLRNHTIEPDTLASEKEFKTYDECTITHPADDLDYGKSTDQMIRDEKNIDMESVDLPEFSFSDDEVCLYSVSIRWIDDPDSPNCSVLIAKYDGFDPPPGYKEEDIFFFGMDEIDIKRAIESQEPCEGEWIIINLDGIVNWDGIYISTLSLDSESKDARDVSKEISENMELQISMHEERRTVE